MARPGQLAEIISQAFHIELPTVREKARVLRNAGLMAKERGGRGPGSMSVRDATHLLLATTGTASVVGCTRPVESHGRSKTDGRWSLNVRIPELIALAADHTLADALEALIQSVISGSFFDAAGVDPNENRSADNYNARLSVRVTLLEPVVRSNIELYLEPVGGPAVYAQPVASQSYQMRISESDQSTVFDPPFQPFLTDLTHEHSFSHATILQIGDLMRG